MAEWVETLKGKAAHIARAWMLMQDEHTALCGMFESEDGVFSIAYTEPGKSRPTLVNDICTRGEAKKLAEQITRTKIIVPRTVLLDA